MPLVTILLVDTVLHGTVTGVFGRKMIGGRVMICGARGRTVCCGSTGIMVPFARIKVPGPRADTEETLLLAFDETKGFVTKPEFVITGKQFLDKVYIDG